MTNIVEALRSIVGSSRNFCCLCFNMCDAEDLVSIDDEANIICSNPEKIILSDLIQSVLGKNLLEYIETMDNICRSCALCLEKSFTFIETCNTNATILAELLAPLDTTIQNVVKTEENSMYLSICLNENTTQILYDREKVHSQKEALERYRILNAPKIESNQKAAKGQHLNSILQCSECDKAFKSISSLQYHFNQTHNNTVYKCSQCTKTFKSKARVKHHETYSHTTMTCNHCGKIFNNKKAWRAHQDCHKTSIICTKCGRTYKNKATFRNHINLNICSQKNRHSPVNAKYTCDYCNKKYTQKVSLKVHIQFEHGNYKGHICEWCGKKFWAQSRLKAHIVTHTQEKNFTCSHCSKKFVSKESLLYHTRLHTGEKPYKCSECSSSFLSASRRSDHFKRHHIGAKPSLECEVCHGKFKSSKVLLKHSKMHAEDKNKQIHTIYKMEKDKNVFIDMDKDTPETMKKELIHHTY